MLTLELYFTHRGYCARLTPEWQKLANKMRGNVKIAYFDTTKSQTPRLVGQIKGTPTIKFIYPSKKNKRDSNKKKIVSDYNGAREWKPLADFAVSRMPNFVKRISGVKGLSEFEEKANAYYLPKILVFSKKDKTSSLLKYLSTEFRRRALIGEIRGSKNNAEIISKFGVETFPHIVALDFEGNVISELQKKPTPNRMKTFLHEHSLKVPYFEDESVLKKIEDRDASSKTEL